MKVNTVEFLLDLHDILSAILATQSADCGKPKEGHAEQWGATKQKIAIINRLIEQNRGESLV